MRLALPIRVKAKRSKRLGVQTFSLNLNDYRNENGFFLGKCKKNYHKIIMACLSEQHGCIKPVKFTNPVRITFTLFKGNNQKCDLSNVCCIVEKFLCDSLQKLSIIPDDDFKHLPEVNYRWGGIDKGNERIEVFIEEI